MTCELVATLEGPEYDRCGGGIGNAHYVFRKARAAATAMATAVQKVEEEEDGVGDDDEQAARLLAGVTIS